MNSKDFLERLSDRLLVLDGAMGTMIQRLQLTEDDFRGCMFRDHTVRLQGNNDILSLTRPDAIRLIHKQYLLAGADIISTNSFNANAISQADYETVKEVSAINRAAASLARDEADSFMDENPERIIFVAGSVGPTNRTASMSPDIDNPAMRNVDFDTLKSAYIEQVRALAEGGVDIILFETVFDTLNLKAGLEAARTVSTLLGRELPVMVSATLAGPSGRILSGQTIEAFLTTVSAFDNVVSVGLNCSWGAKEMRPFIADLSVKTTLPVSCHPNAGLPDENGSYRTTPEDFASAVASILRDNSVNVIGGCCGTTPEHIAAIARIVDSFTPRIPKPLTPALRLAGLEALEISQSSNFINVGERCNVAGSRKFLRLIKEKSYSEALSIARRQVLDGARIIDINMDDSLIDARTEMSHFLRLLASDPDVASVPFMIDSSDWNVLEEGLKNIQGKAVVNSISLKEGEADFLRKAEIIRNHGAAVVVMAFDEEGQADTFGRKIEICSRAYRLLVDKTGFNPHDIIFDPNIMAVATGIDEHDLYGRDFIKAVRWIKSNLPGASVSGGVSNLSFAFRGHNHLRECMHAVFLYHAISAGLDMAIVNAASVLSYEDVEPRLRSLLDNLFLNGSHEAAQALTEYAASDGDNSVNCASDVTTVDRSSEPVYIRLRNAVLRGCDEFLADDIAEAVNAGYTALQLIEGPLMEGVTHVGTLFGEGKMFLPQVVRTARVMKHAVDLLRPQLEADKSAGATSSAGKILLATVKGDVHDIGKNIVAIVLECNNFEVIDLGVMVSAETIIDAAWRYNPDIIGLSGLITPSLGEMATVAKRLNDTGIHIPIIVGGATTSRLHTALKIAPLTSAPVIHAADAAKDPVIATQLLNTDTRQEYIAHINEEYALLRQQHAEAVSPLLPLDEARKRKTHIEWDTYPSPVPAISGVQILSELPLEDIFQFINWRMFFNFWQLSENTESEEARRLRKDAEQMLNELASSATSVVRAAVGVFDAYSTEDDCIVIKSVKFPMLRRQQANADGVCLSAADFVRPKDSGSDYVGAFVVSAEANTLKEKYASDPYSLMLLKSLLDRLAEAGSEYVHMLVRRNLWAYSPEEQLDIETILAAGYRGIRPAMGYPMTPDQLLNRNIAALLPLGSIGVNVTDNGALSPASTVSGLYIAHPDSRYFMIGRIDDDQLADYARRRGTDVNSMRTILSKNL